jgi:hypothetical protein
MHCGWRRFKASKRFFFEKEKQKTFVFSVRGNASRLPPPSKDKNFLLLFFKKEALACSSSVLGGLVHLLYEVRRHSSFCIQRVLNLRSIRTIRGKTAAGFAILLALASCATPAHVVMTAPPPPVGHIYPTRAQMPAPTYRWVHITPAESEEYQQAFNVIALKSALMVAALSCDQQDKYDSFMTRFHSHILTEQHVMDSYFRRASGYSGQSREDSFVTLLANNQSVAGIAEGQVFCLNNDAEFNAVLALQTPDALDSFVTAEAPSVADPQPAVAVMVAPRHRVTARIERRYRVITRVEPKHKVVAKVVPKHKVVASQP